MWHRIWMTIPPSKSHTMRALLFEFLSKKPCKIENILIAPEVLAFQNTLQNWDKIFFIDVKNSGLALHFLLVLAVLRSATTVIDGDTSIRTLRPIAPLVDALREAGARIRYLEKEGFAPVEVRGPIQAANVSLVGTNSQHVSALLIAFSQVSGLSTVEVISPKETPYVQMTLDWLQRFQGVIEHEGFFRFSIEGPLPISPFSYKVVSDFSSAAFILAAHRILGIEGDFSLLDFEDSQGDKEIFQMLDQEECTIFDTPDLLPIIMVLGVLGKGPKRIHGIHVARQKESDRPLVMQKELEKMGAKISINWERDFLEIEPSVLKGAEVDSHHDHRICMSLAVAALGAEGKTIVNGVDCVAKTFPNFFETYCSCRFAEIGKNDSGQVSILPIWNSASGSR
ncbi:MAG: 3-phosphoshikimate 1-carboxyvinyltransferase [Chlamydiia bacterium]